MDVSKYASKAPSLLSCILMQHLTASHQCHPPFTPCSPQIGCYYGNSRIRSRPVSAVSLSLLSLLGSRLQAFLLWRGSLFYFDSLFFFPGYKMEDERVLFIKGWVVFVKPRRFHWGSALFSPFMFLLWVHIHFQIFLCFFFNFNPLLVPHTVHYGLG